MGIPKRWIRITIDCLRNADIAVSNMLELAGAISVSISLDRDTRSSVQGLFDEDSVDVDEFQEQISPKSREDEKFSVKVDSIEDRDWVAVSQQSMSPVVLNSGLNIVAPWHVYPPTDGNTVVINPGQSFGTGHHETTQLCAETLSELELNGKIVIDYGCGSGVLAICALVLGADYAWGVDIDPDARRESVKNAQRNYVDKKFCALEAEELPTDTQADVTVANLFADALVALSGDLIQLTTDGGWIVLSGILQPQVERVSRAYFGHVDFTAKYDGDWVVLLGKKTNNILLNRV